MQWLVSFLRWIFSWSFVFFLVPVLGVATFLWAPALDSWLPRDVSEHGRTIDDLFMFILYLTGIVFIVTEVVLAWFVWKYNRTRNPEPAKFTHGSHALEVVWTILPAATLLFIAVYQMEAWAAAKMRPPMVIENGLEVPMPPIAEVTGRQFEWRIRYPGGDGVLDTPDDIHTVNDLHLPVGEEIMLHIKSEDVLHSFFLPNMRIKQDVVPGMLQRMWFQANETGSFDIVCAELCGWGHYKMKGQVTFEARSRFDAWLNAKYSEQNTKTAPPPPEDEEEE
jgi:cytochrome c oxidase subunit 2